MSAVCRNCRWFGQSPVCGQTICTHPDASMTDRIRGRVYPPLTDITGAKTKATEKTIADCDREGRFEESRPWWNIWRTA